MSLRKEKPETGEDVLGLIVTGASVINRVERVKDAFRPKPWKKDIRELNKKVKEFKRDVDESVGDKPTFRKMLGRIALYLEWKRDLKGLKEDMDRLKGIIQSRRDDVPYVPPLKTRIKRRVDSSVIIPIKNARNWPRSSHVSTHIWRYRLMRPLGLEYPSVRGLLGHIAHGDESMSCAARTVMGQRILYRNDGEKIIPSLVRALKDKDAEVRCVAASKIGSFKENAAPALPALIEALNDPVLNVRVEATYTIAKMGPKAKGAAPALFGIMAHSKDRVEVLMKKAAPEDAAGLGYCAAVALVKIGWHSGRSPEDAEFKVLIETLNKALEDKEFHSKDYVCRAIGMLGQDGAVAIPGLVEIVEKRNCDSDAAFEALVKIGPKAVGDLLYLGLRYYELKEKAGEAIAKMGVDAVPGVIDAMGNSDIRPTCTDILKQIGEPAVPLLTKVLKGGDENARSNVAWVLGGMGKAAEPAIPALITALGDSSEKVHGAAAGALGSIGEPAIPALIEVGRSGSLVARHQAFQALICMQERAVAALPFLIESLRDPDMRISAAVTLGQIGGKAVEALPDLHRAALAGHEGRKAIQGAINEIVKQTKRPSGVREISERPKDVTIERMLRGMASDVRQTGSRCRVAGL